ncbi:YHS domain-containing protein [Methanocella conradii]|nr:YHS domain-containing protein [Methanocella conradii]
MVKDPVCNMEVNPTSPGAKETYQGKTYYFCCESCKATFDKNPDKYAGKA